MYDKTNEDYDVNDLIRDELYKNMDLEYGKFTASLNPGCGNIIGVRIPVLRKMAKEIAKVNWKEYLDGALDDTMEETMLQGIVLGYANGRCEDILLYAKRFIPKIDNWSVCDTFCNTFQISRKFPEEVWNFLTSYITPEATEFELRVVVVMMMSHFLTEEYIDRVLFTYNMITPKNYPKAFGVGAPVEGTRGYYLKMGIAWGLATAFAKFPEKTMELMKNNDIDDDTYNKAIQKMRESYRVSAEDKEILKSMKR